MRILFTGGGGAGNEALFRLWQDKYELHFADASPTSFAPALPPDRCHVVPFAHDPSFVSTVADLCAQSAIGLLVPGVDEELLSMPRVAVRAPHLKILVPAPDYVAAMLDKLEAMTLLRARGIDAPRSTTLDQAATIGFPCFAKPRRGRGSRGIQVLPDPESTQAHLRLSGLAANDIVVQELVTGQEYTVMMSADRSGRLHAIVPVRVETKRVITLRAETDANPVVIDACAAIHRACPAAGCYNIQLFLTPDGRVRPFEINPRISTTFCLGIAAGIDPVAIFLGNAAPNALLPFRSGVRLSRYWYNHFS